MFLWLSGIYKSPTWYSPFPVDSNSNCRVCGSKRVQRYVFTFPSCQGEISMVSQSSLEQITPLMLSDVSWGEISLCKGFLSKKSLAALSGVIRKVG